MKIFRQALVNANSSFSYLLKNEAAVLFAIVLGCELSDQFILWIQGHLGLPDMQNIPLMLMRVTFSLAEMFFILTVVCRRLYERENHLPRGSFWADLAKYSPPLLNEGLRALGVILLWLLALIIPGIYKYVQLSFVTLIVLVDPDYEAGKIDALKESEKLAKGMWWMLFLFLFLSGGLAYWLEYNKEKFNAFSNIGLWVVFFAILALLNLYLNVLLYEIYSVKRSVLRNSKH